MLRSAEQSERTVLFVCRHVILPVYLTHDFSFSTILLTLKQNASSPLKRGGRSSGVWLVALATARQRLHECDLFVSVRPLARRLQQRSDDQPRFQCTKDSGYKTFPRYPRDHGYILQLCRKLYLMSHAESLLLKMYLKEHTALL